MSKRAKKSKADTKPYLRETIAPEPEVVERSCDLCGRAYIPLLPTICAPCGYRQATPTMQVLDLIEAHGEACDCPTCELAFFTPEDPPSETVSSQTDSEKIRAVAREAYDLWRRGYDGPFMGDDIVPLFKALAELDKARIKL